MLRKRVCCLPGALPAATHQRALRTWGNQIHCIVERRMRLPALPCGGSHGGELLQLGGFGLHCWRFCEPAIMSGITARQDLERKDQHDRHCQHSMTIPNIGGNTTGDSNDRQRS